MKHLFLRKPLLPCVLLVLLCISCGFVALFSQSISDNQATVEEMYQSFHLTYNILPGPESDGILRLRDKTAQQLLSIEGIEESSYYLECPYSLWEPYDLSGFSTVYGTNSIDFFSQNREIEIIYGDGIDVWNEETFSEEHDRPFIPCIIDEVLSGYLNIHPGDEIVIIPADEDGQSSESAPSAKLKVDGLFRNNSGLLAPFGIIIPSYAFWGDNGLLYSSKMLQSFFYYRAFQLLAEKSYNHDYQRITDDVKELLNNDGGGFTVQTNSRVLERTVRPVEQKVRTQHFLQLPLACSLGIAIVAICVFMCVGFSDTVFIQLLHGENRLSVWVKMVGYVLLLLVIEAAIALLIVRAIAAPERFPIAIRYLAIVVVVAVIACGICEAICCKKNLISYFQSREN